jgi:hypothetical protein
MIGSLLSRMSDAEKLSPQQLQQTVKDGVLPAGIASMISQDDAGEHSMPSAPPPGTVADQVINQADQALSPEDKIMQHINLLKRDISKIQEGVQSGEIKAYEGIPLLKEKVNQLGKLQAMLQPQMPQQMPQMPPQAPQAPQGINTAQSNLPTQMAEGGIIGYAKGGKAFIDADEENDDLSGEEDYQNALKMHRDAQLRRQQEQESYNQPMGEGMGSAIMSVADKTKPNYSSFVNKTPDVQQAYKKETGGIQDIINAKAQKYNLPPALLHSIAKAESGLDPNAGNKTGSSAKGLYQFIDTTWKGMGGKEGEQFDPDINSEMGAKYIRQNAEFLKNKLGRNPTYSEVYGAHFFGPSGAAALLSKGKPDMPIEQGLATFESGKRVKTIMNQNPNLKGKTIGQVFGDLESKAGQGIVSLAHGGEIPSFSGNTSYGSQVSDAFRSGYDRIFGGDSTPNVSSTQAPITTEEALENLQKAKASQSQRPPIAPPSRGSTFSGIDNLPTNKPSLSQSLSAFKKYGASSDANVFPSVPGTGGMADLNYYNELMAELKKDPNYQPYKDEIAKLLKKNPELATQSVQLTPPSATVNNDVAKPKTYSDQTSRGNAPAVFAAKEPEVKYNYQTGDAYQPGQDITALMQPTPEAAPSAWDEFVNQAKSSREDLKKQKEEDRYMALLTAGLGIAGGSSPYAMENIGKGALAGVQNLSEANKLRASQQAAIDKNMLGALHYGSLDKYYASMGLSKEERDKLAREGLNEKRFAREDLNRRYNMGLLEKMETTAEKNAQALVAASMKTNPALMTAGPEQISAIRAAETQKILRKMPQYYNLFKQVHSYDPFEMGSTESAGNPNLDLNKYVK